MNLLTTPWGPLWSNGTVLALHCRMRSAFGSRTSGQLRPWHRSLWLQALTLHTSLGDVKLELACGDCPRTCENFLALAGSGYYDNTIFHRNIKGFMIQVGMDVCRGSGGEVLGHVDLGDRAWRMAGAGRARRLPRLCRPSPTPPPTPSAGPDPDRPRAAIPRAPARVAGASTTRPTASSPTSWRTACSTPSAACWPWPTRAPTATARSFSLPTRPTRT